MAKKSAKQRASKNKHRSQLSDFDASTHQLLRLPREWWVAVALRATLRAIPLFYSVDNLDKIILQVFRAAAVAELAVLAPDHIRNADFAYKTYGQVVDGGDELEARPHAILFASAFTLYAAYTTSDEAAFQNVQIALGNTTSVFGKPESQTDIAFRNDEHFAEPEALYSLRLWPTSMPEAISEQWRSLSARLLALGSHWAIWILWYENKLIGSGTPSSLEAAAFTDVDGDFPWNDKLPWSDGAAEVNKAIARRLDLLKTNSLTEVPEQSPAPVRVEERDGRISKASDRDSRLNASERDFKDWRDPVVDHLGELTSSDFASGTNHSRVRDRLRSLEKLLPGEIAEVKDRQFRIGYEIERFEKLLAAYRSGGDDMPELNAAQLADLEHLQVALKMGIDKLERWADFRKQAAESPAQEGNADGAAVADALDQMAVEMEKRPQFFHPEMPESFRALAEAARDPLGATQTIVYGAVKSAENLVSYLGQRALGIGMKGMEAVENHISKTVAIGLVTAVSGAAISLSTALPQGWKWLEPLLKAIGAGG